MKNRFFAWAILMLILCTGLFYACSKQGVSSSNVPSGQQKVSFYLTDGPGFFDSVFIDIKTVAVVVDTCSREDFEFFDSTCAIRDTINFNEGVYNLAGLRNGIDTILASGNIPAGTVKRIIINLGTNNYLVKNGVRYPLNTFGDDGSHIIIKLRGDEFETTNVNLNNLWLDFDVERSIFRLWDGKFYLRPVIRIFAEIKTGVISGTVLPRDAFPVISVINGQDTSYALPDWDGDFKVRGLQTGTYSIFINSSNGYNDTTITNVSVNVGNKTDIGVIHLSK